MDCLMAYLDLARYDADWLIDDLNMADKQFFIDLLDTFTSFVSSSESDDCQTFHEPV